MRHAGARQAIDGRRQELRNLWLVWQNQAQKLSELADVPMWLRFPRVAWVGDVLAEVKVCDSLEPLRSTFGRRALVLNQEPFAQEHAVECDGADSNAELFQQIACGLRHLA